MLFLLVSVLLWSQQPDVPSITPNAWDISPTTCNLPAPASISTTSGSESSLDISWAPVSGASGYQFSLFDGNTRIVYQWQTGTSRQVNQLTPGHQYRIEVAAACSESSVSEIIVITDLVL